MNTTDLSAPGAEPIAMKTTLIPRRADPVGLAARRHAQPSRPVWSRSTVRLGLALSVAAIAASVIVEATTTISSAAMVTGIAVVAFALSWYVDERARSNDSPERRRPR